MKQNTILWVIGIAILLLLVLNQNGIFEMKKKVINGYWDEPTQQCRSAPDRPSGIPYTPSETETTFYQCCFNNQSQQIDCNNPSDLFGSFAIYQGQEGLFFVTHGITITNTGNVDLTNAWIESATWTPSNTGLTNAYSTVIGSAYGSPLGQGLALDFSTGQIDLQAIGGSPGSTNTYDLSLVAKSSATGLPDSSETIPASITVEQEGIGYSVDVKLGGPPVDYTGYWSFDGDAFDESFNENHGVVKVLASAYYPFDGNAIDESINTNDGIVEGAVLTTDNLGNPSGAYDVSHGDIVIPSFNDVENNIISVFILAKKTADGQGAIISHSDHGTSINQRSWNIRVGEYSSTFDDKVTITISSNGLNWDKQWKTNDAILADGEWHLIGFTFNNGILKIYIDEEEYTNLNKIEDNVITSIYQSTSNIRIGSQTYNNGSDQFFEGKVTNVLILNKVLSNFEVSKLSNLSFISKLNNPYNTGIENQAFTFWGGGSGTDKATLGNYIELNSALEVTSNSHSISFSYRTTDNNFQTLFQSYLNSQSSNIEFRPSDNTILVESRSNNFWDEDFETGIDIDDGEWHDYVLVFSPTDSKLYVDKILTSTQSANTDTLNFIYKIFGGYGNTGYTYGECPNGDLDKVKIFPRPISQYEVNEL